MVTAMATMVIRIPKAEALAAVRFSLPGNRIPTRALGQLRPQQRRQLKQWHLLYETTNDPVTGSFGFRRPMTYAELIAATVSDYCTAPMTLRWCDRHWHHHWQLGSDRILDIEEDLAGASSQAGIPESWHLAQSLLAVIAMQMEVGRHTFDSQARVGPAPLQAVEPTA